jgi:coproporphyrinogen III oxidase
MIHEYINDYKGYYGCEGDWMLQFVRVVESKCYHSRESDFATFQEWCDQKFPAND